MVAQDTGSVVGVLVAFEPDDSFFIGVESTLQQLGRLVIFDNGLRPPQRAQLERLAAALPHQLRLAGDGVNWGVAGGFNRAAQVACDWCADSIGEVWLLFLDQDTRLEPGFLDKMLAASRGLPAAFARIGVLGASFFTDRSGSWTDPGLRKSTIKSFLDVAVVRTVITSGSMVPLHVWQELSGLREDYFIDHVDHEFCLRARSRGYQVLQVRKPLMHHPIGRTIEHRVMGFDICVTNHAPLRWFYFIRNLMALYRPYGLPEWPWLLRETWAVLKRFFWMCCLEQERKTKVIFALRGGLAGLRALVTGRLVGPG